MVNAMTADLIDISVVFSLRSPMVEPLSVESLVLLMDYVCKREHDSRVGVRPARRRSFLDLPDDVDRCTVPVFDNPHHFVRGGAREYQKCRRPQEPCCREEPGWRSLEDGIPDRWASPQSSGNGVLDPFEIIRVHREVASEDRAKENSFHLREWRRFIGIITNVNRCFCLLCKYLNHEIYSNLRNQRDPTMLRSKLHAREGSALLHEHMDR